MYREALRPAWVEVNLSNFRHNIKAIKNHVAGKAELIGVVKADSYGLGAVKICEILKEEGVKIFAVATIAEGIALRDAGYTDEDIIVLGLSPGIYADVIVKYDLTVAVDSYSFASALSEADISAGKTAKGIIAFDTGMGRIGYRPDDDYVDEIKKMDDLKGFEYVGMFSHMSTADDVNKDYSHIQAEKYKGIVDKLEANGIDMKIKSFANSASIIDLPETYYTHVRPGIIQYGQYAQDEINKEAVPIKRVMEVKAVIMKLKEINDGDSVGYGRKFIAKGKRKIATCNIGYADGFPRAWSPSGKVIINGVYAPIAGNICMDQFMIDVTDVPNVKSGDEVIVMGSDGKLNVYPEEIASATSTIHYEIISSFGMRLPKIYVE